MVAMLLRGPPPARPGVRGDVPAIIGWVDECLKAVNRRLVELELIFALFMLHFDKNAL